MTEDRLSRIEDKLDRLADAMTTLVRVEERMGAFNDRLGVIDARLAKHSDRLDLVEKLAERNTQSLGFGERVFWIVATVGAGVAGKMLFGG
jgi:uncharacterized protein YerC